MDELKDAIRNAGSVMVLMPEHASDKDFLAALQIQKINQEKIHLVAPQAQEERWKDTFDIRPVKREFAISIDTALSPVEELRYEKNDSLLTIFLTHKNMFNQNALSFSEHLPRTDLIVSIGFGTREEAERYIESLPDMGTARHIWIDEAHSLPKTEKLSSPSINLMGRLMVRSRLDTDLGVLWSFLTREDFLKADATPAAVTHLIETLTSIAQLPKALIIFWQYGEAKTKGLLWSRDLGLVSLFATTFAIEHASNPLELPEFDNFIEAETEVRKLLHTQPLG